MRVEKIVEELYKMIGEVPESVVEEYKWFALPMSFKKHNYTLELNFPQHRFEYFNDELMGGNWYLKSHPFYFEDTSNDSI